VAPSRNLPGVKPIPPPVLKAWTWFFLPMLGQLIALLFCAAALKWGWLGPPGPGVGGRLNLIIGVTSAVMIAGQAVAIVNLIRLRRRLRETRGRVCLKCGFDLRGLGEAGACPECGRPFDIPADRARWRSFVRFDG
jgi:hypothetical protein